MTPKEILEQTRRLINEHAAGDPDKWWYVNRFVFARLQLDERKTKARIKQDLLASDTPCHGCGQRFESKRNVHLHRRDDSKGYSAGNCVLMHAECHRKYHAKNAQKEERSPGRKVVCAKSSKRYEDKPFIYWWDIAPNQAERLDQYDAIAFVQKDTGRRCILPAATLKVFLTPERQTTRNAGNWGIKVLKGQPDELAFEPPSRSQEWLLLPVTWLDESAED